MKKSVVGGICNSRLGVVEQQEYKLKGVCTWFAMFCLLSMGVFCTTSVYGEQYRTSDKTRVIKFSYPDFSDLSLWMVNQNAVKTPVLDQGRKVLRLTESRPSQAGSAFITERIYLEGDDGFKGSFSALFSFRIHGNNGITDAVNDNYTGADGLAFVVQTQSNTAGSIGMGMGYQGILHSVAVEFDTWNNNNIHEPNLAGDTDYNHVGIYAQGDVPYPVGGFAKLDPGKGIMKNGNVWYAWVDYNGNTQKLEARISSRNIRPVAPFHTEVIDLPAVLTRPDVFVGFTSATGEAYSNHDILSFYFTNKHDPYKENLIDDHMYSIPEKSPAGTEVGTVSLVDNATGDITVSLIDAVPLEFIYSESTRDIEVAPGASLVFDEKSSYSFRMEAYKRIEHTPDIIDEVYDTATVTINLEKADQPCFIFANEKKQHTTLSSAFKKREIFTTATHEVTLELQDEEGNLIPLSESAEIFFTQHNKKPQVDIDLYTTAFTLTGSDTVRAIAEVAGYINPVEGYWVFEQQLPKGRIIATPSVNTPGKYTFSTETLNVGLAFVTESGDTLFPSDAIAFYYTLGDVAPVIGTIETKKFTGAAPITIADDDTLRAIVVTNHFEEPDEGMWYYDRELHQAKLTATPGSDSVYVYDKPSIDVTLETNVGNKIYYTLDGTEPEEGISDSLASHMGVVTIYGDDTLKALAVGSAYRKKDSLWIYDSQLPALYIEADAGTKDDTVTFYFDTTAALRAVDSLGDVVEDARIFYRIDTAFSTVIDSTEGTLYRRTLTIDTTVTLQTVAYHPNYQSASAEWHYALKLEENSLEVHTFDTAWESGELINGDVLLSERDTAHFGHNLQIVLKTSADSVEYEKDGTVINYFPGDTIYLNDDDPDTTILPVRSFSHGFKSISQDFVFVRDTVGQLVVSPPGKKFTGEKQDLSLSLTKSWINPVIYFDTSGRFEEYADPITLQRSNVLRVYANADFAVESDTVVEQYIKAISATSAYYFDADGDGAIDSARIECNGSNEDKPDSIEFTDPFSTAVFVAERSDIKRESDSLFTISFTEPFQFMGSTGFTSAKAMLFGETFSDDGFQVRDSIAPVLLSGALFPGEITSVNPVERADDSLYLVYSEEISLGTNKSPVVIYNESEDEAYTLSVEDTEVKITDTLINGEEYSVSRAWFRVVDYNSSTLFPQKGDSVNIALESKTGDSHGVLQRVKSNRKVSLHVGDIPYKLLVQAITPVDPEEYTVPDELQVDPNSEKGLVIVADFLMLMENGNQDGTITILDNIGNEIKRCSGRRDDAEGLSIGLIENRTTKLVFQWDGRNTIGRKVGDGAYVAEITIDDGRGKTYNEQVIIGVTREK